ncbi:MAG: phosphatidylglycerophosphatase A [Candidatus Omnitrophota bacterium]
MKKIHRYIATVLGLGYFPIAPGTVGSFAGLLLCLLLHKYVILYIIIFIILFAAGVITSGKVEKESGQKDPSYVIIDEFACIFLVFLLIPLKPLYVITGFIIYRIIDITKPPPIRLLEKREGGWGIMLDDALAAIYTNILLQILTRLI